MKISLRQDKGIAILDVAGDVDPRQFQVLKAGLTKLLRDGKNRIILNLTDAKNLDSDVIREIAIVDVFARELAGKIVLTSPNEELKKTVLSFSKPPVVPFITSIELAIEFFEKSKPETEDSETVENLQKQLAQKDKELASLQAAMKLMDKTEITNLRKEKTELQTKAKMLEKQVEALLKSRQGPADAEGFLDKITTLEEAVKKLSGKKE